MVSSLQLLSSLGHEGINWDQDLLGSHITCDKVRESIHRRVASIVCKLVANICVLTIGRSGSDHSPWIQVLDCQLNVVLCSCILSKISFHEECQIDGCVVFRIISLCIGSLLPDRLLVLFYEPSESTLSNNDDTVTLLLCSFND